MECRLRLIGFTFRANAVCKISASKPLLLNTSKISPSVSMASRKISFAAPAMSKIRNVTVTRVSAFPLKINGIIFNQFFGDIYDCFYLVKPAFSGFTQPAIVVIPKVRKRVKQGYI